MPQARPAKGLALALDYVRRGRAQQDHVFNSPCVGQVFGGRWSAWSWPPSTTSLWLTEPSKKPAPQPQHKHPWAAKVQADDKPLTNLDLINTRQEYFKPQPPQPASCFHLTPCTVPAEGLHRNQTCADPEMRPDFDCTCLLQRGWLEATSSNIGMCVLRGQRVVQDPPTTHAC